MHIDFIGPGVHIKPLGGPVYLSAQEVLELVRWGLSHKRELAAKARENIESIRTDNTASESKGAYYL